MTAATVGLVRRLPRQPKGNGARSACGVLRERILRLQILPGAKLDEASLVAEFGISRTPLREAIVRLSAEGLVELLPNRGARVAPLDLIDTVQFFEAFDLMQRTVNHWAAIRRTESDLDAIRRGRDAFESATSRRDIAGSVETNRQLHMAIAAAARNSHVEVTLHRLLEHGTRLCWVWYTHFPPPEVNNDIDVSCREHREIVAAIEAGDAERADQLGHLHTETFRARMKDFLLESLSTAIRLG